MMAETTRLALEQGAARLWLRASLALGVFIALAQPHAAARDGLKSTRAVARQTPRFVHHGPFRIGAVEYYPYMFEGHVHTLHSMDARQSTVSILQAAERLGLDALVITDHGSSESRHDFASYKGPLVPFVGREVGGVFGHAVMWKVADDEHQDPTRTSLAQRCAFAHARGGLLIFAHPGWWISGNEHNPMEWMTPQAMRRGGVAGDVDAIELWNGVYRTPLPRLIEAWVELLEAGVFVPIVGNSDFHRFHVHHLGVPHNIAFCDVPDVSTCLWSAVRAGRIVVSDGPYAVLSVDDKLPGQVVVHPTEPLHVNVEALARAGGTLRLYLGREVVRSLQLRPGVRSLAMWRVPVPQSDTYVRIEIVHARKTRARADKTSISLLSNPVLIDVGPRRARWR